MCVYVYIWYNNDILYICNNNDIICKEGEYFPVKNWEEKRISVLYFIVQKFNKSHLTQVL